MASRPNRSRRAHSQSPARDAARASGRDVPQEIARENEPWVHEADEPRLIRCEPHGLGHGPYRTCAGDDWHGRSHRPLRRLRKHAFRCRRPNTGRKGLDRTALARKTANSTSESTRVVYHLNQQRIRTT